MTEYKHEEDRVRGQKLTRSERVVRFRGSERYTCPASCRSRCQRTAAVEGVHGVRPTFRAKRGCAVRVLSDDNDCYGRLGCVLQPAYERNLDVTSSSFHRVDTFHMMSFAVSIS